MKKVYQAINEEKEGSPLQACIASLLELELNEVPDISNDGTFWRLQEWLSNIGLALIWINLKEKQYGYLNLIPKGTLFIEAGRSPRGDWLHCVISRFEGDQYDPRPEKFFDPHPHGAFLNGSAEFAIFLGVKMTE